MGATGQEQDVSDSSPDGCRADPRSTRRSGMLVDVNPLLRWLRRADAAAATRAARNAGLALGERRRIDRAVNRLAEQFDASSAPDER